MVNWSFPTVSHGAWTPGKAPRPRTGVPACGFLRPLPDAPYRPAPLQILERQPLAYIDPLARVGGRSNQADRFDDSAVRQCGRRDNQAGAGLTSPHKLAERGADADIVGQQQPPEIAGATKHREIVQTVQSGALVHEDIHAGRTS